MNFGFIGVRVGLSFALVLGCCGVDFLGLALAVVLPLLPFEYNIILIQTMIPSKSNEKYELRG